MAEEERKDTSPVPGYALVPERLDAPRKAETDDDSRTETETGTPREATLRKLFGGAMECLLPAAFVDVSDLRQVPDHQEAFVSRVDGVSIVIEVLSFEEDLSSEGDGASARHFFDDLAAANGAASSSCDFCADLTDSIMPALAPYAKAALAGRQTVAKFRGGAPPEAIRLYLVNVRLPNVGTDLLITVNVPYPTEEATATSMASADTFTAADRPVDEQAQTSPGGSGPDEALAAEDEGGVDAVGVPLKGLPEAVSVEGRAGVPALRSLLRSFKILDWSLFC